jgi:hypothetical protein
LQGGCSPTTIASTAGYRRPIASLAVLADESENWQPSDFAYQLSGCTVGICFSIVRFLDYVCQTEALLKDTNAFALVNAAHLFTPSTGSDPEQWYAAKWRLAERLYERKAARQTHHRLVQRHRPADAAAGRNGATTTGRSQRTSGGLLNHSK